MTRFGAGVGYMAVTGKIGGGSSMPSPAVRNTAWRCLPLHFGEGSAAYLWADRAASRAPAPTYHSEEE